MLRASERIDALDGQQVRRYARNARSHAVEHLAQLLQVGFAGGVVDRRRAFGQDCGHNDVGGTRHRSLVQQHVGALQLFAFDHEELVGDVEVEFRAELLESDEVGVEPAAADLVAARLGDVAHAEAGQHRADEHHRTPQARAAPAVVLRAQIFEVDLLGAEAVGVFGELFDLDAHAAQQLDELHDVQNPGDIVHRDPFGSQQRGAEYLQRLVFGALGRNATVKAVASFDFENCHMRDN